MKDEDDEAIVRALSKVLLYSCERALGRLTWGQPDSEKRVRRMTISLVKNLPRLLKAYQTDNEIIVALVETSRLLNLDVVSEDSADHLYQQVLAEIRDLFVRSGDREIFTAAIASLYELSLGHHQLSEIARQALDRLSVECARLDQDHSIPKFLAAARLVDISDDGRVREWLIQQLDTTTETETIADCLECLDYFFRWDINRIRRHPELADDYRSVYDQSLSVFSRYLSQDDNRSKIEAFKAVSTVLALSPFLKRESTLFDDDFLLKFFQSFHSSSHKQELFIYAQKPIETHGIDIQFSVHLLLYFSDEVLQPSVKYLWKQLAGFKPISGRQVLSAFQLAPLGPQEMRASARFLVGKVSASDVLSRWFEKENEDLLPVALPFLFGLTPTEAEGFQAVAPARFQEVLGRIAGGEKPGQKVISAILSGPATRAVRKQAQSQLVVDADDGDQIEFEEPEETFVSRPNRH
jgi:hypothetical protein